MQPYIGEIRMFAGNFAPVGWALCQGQLLPISENETLFQLIGTTYGGDGENTFGLPNLSGRIPIHMGTGPTGVTYQIGEMAGVETVTLSTQQIPTHNHAPAVTENSSTYNGIYASSQNAISESVSAVIAGRDPSGNKIYGDNENADMAEVQATGGNQPHENMPPFLTVSFIISLYGIFPSPT